MQNRKMTDRYTDQGVTIEIHEYTRLDLASVEAAKSAYYASKQGMTVKQLRITLEGGEAYLQPGALQYYHGQIQMRTAAHTGAQGGGGLQGLIGRAIQSAGTGESAYRNLFSGRGEIWTEPTFGHYLIAELDGSDTLLVDDKAFYAASGGVQVGMHVNTNIAAGLLGGNGFAMPKVSGRGLLVLETPVSPDEMDVIEVNGELAVDGDLAVMYTASLDMRIEKAQRGIMGTMRSGEGLLHVFRGRGTVWVCPTLALVRMFEPPPPPPTSGSSR